MANQQDFLKFLDNGPSPYHGNIFILNALYNKSNFLVVETASQFLKKNGFQQLNLGNHWKLQRGGKYFLTKYVFPRLSIPIDDWPNVLGVTHR